MAASDGDSDEARSLRPLQAVACTYRIAFGPRGWHEILTLRGEMPRKATPRQPVNADMDGFSLQAAVLVEALGRDRLERLCLCITRPALANERAQCKASGPTALRTR